MPGGDLCDVVGRDPFAFSPCCCSAQTLKHVHRFLSSLVSNVLSLTVPCGRTFMSSFPLYCSYVLYDYGSLGFGSSCYSTTFNFQGINK